MDSRGMDLSGTLNLYAKYDMGVSYDRYLMYVSGCGLFIASCLVFTFLVCDYPWYSVLGGLFLVALVVVHPYYYAFDMNRRSIIRAKPFMSLFILAYVVAIPAVVFCYLGFGRYASRGSDVVKSSPLAPSLTLSDLVGQWGGLSLDKDYFTTSDGFIAFNLSKSIVNTVNPHDLMETDSLYYGLSNPVIDRVFEPANITYSNPYVSEIDLFGSGNPVVISDVRSQWTVAPIFQAPSACLLHPPPLHITCMLPNKIVGWAVATDTASVCRYIQSNACSAHQRLSVSYPSTFNPPAAPIKPGISGIVSSGPPDFIVEAFRRRFVADGWPIDADTDMYPNGMPSIWIQALPDTQLIMESANSNFFIFQIIAAVLIAFVLVLMLLPLYLDVVTDKLVMALVEEQKQTNSVNEREANQREIRKRAVEQILS